MEKAKSLGMKVPAMPVIPEAHKNDEHMFGLPYSHRTKIGGARKLCFNALIARPVGRKEVQATKKAKEAMPPEPPVASKSKRLPRRIEKRAAE